ncbi:MAG: UDP-N-acetylmuramoyl-L-alanine--D-glutamate ligase [Cyanobacteria bacterium J06641_5]
MPQATVIGLGRSGIAAARLLKLMGYEVLLGDRGDTPALREKAADLREAGIAVCLDHTPDWEIERPNLLVVSPGVPWDAVPIVAARDCGIETIGELELAWRHLQNCSWLGITGTNGKTTTTALLAAMLQASGLDAQACGNIGNAACELAIDVLTAARPKPDWIVAELSSFQIEAAPKLTPNIGVWTTFTPDHLDRHRTLERYFDIKNSLVQRCPVQIINGDASELRDRGTATWPSAHWTSVGGQAELLGVPKGGIYIEPVDGEEWVIAFGEQVAPVATLKMLGEHNRQNLLLAVGAARLAGATPEAIARAIAEFPGVPHRLEWICRHGGTDFINDSKATNYDAAIVGLDAVPTPAISIAGGQPKAGDDAAWLAAIAVKVVKVLLIGEAAPSFAERLAASGYENFEIVETLEVAVSRSAELAESLQAKVVLLSPACASFDQYGSFEERGDHFRQLCLAL